MEKTDSQKLIFAVKKGDTDAVEQLLELVDVNKRSRDYPNCTPLHYACQEGHLDMSKLLVSFFRFTLTQIHYF